MKTYKQYKAELRRNKQVVLSHQQTFNDAVAITISEIATALNMTEAALKAMIK